MTKLDNPNPTMPAGARNTAPENEMENISAKTVTGLTVMHVSPAVDSSGKPLPVDSDPMLYRAFSHPLPELVNVDAYLERDDPTRTVSDFLIRY